MILKKYSPIGELSGFAKEYTESLVHALGHTALICDKDQIVSAAGGARKELQDKNISPELEGVLKDRLHRRRQRAGGQDDPHPRGGGDAQPLRGARSSPPSSSRARPWAR